MWKEVNTKDSSEITATAQKTLPNLKFATYDGTLVSDFPTDLPQVLFNNNVRFFKV